MAKFIKRKNELDKAKTDDIGPNLNIGTIINQVSNSHSQFSQTSNSDPNASNINVFVSNVNVNTNQSVNIVNTFGKSDNTSEDEPDEPDTPQGNYCDMFCRHYCEEYYDSGGGVVGSIDSEGYSEYYCSLGHSLVTGRFCEDYE